jgi:D-serine deaminase-like pyridoxal phosphate-dependent protein
MISNIKRPTLVIRESVCRANIDRMLSKAKASDVIFRPHFKTHQSLDTGQWFREAGVDRITVSSAAMAQRFASAGWSDISIAFPANLREIAEYDRLAKEIRLNLLADSVETIKELTTNMSHQAGIFIEIDCGYGRSGARYDDHERINAVIDQVRRSGKLVFKGFLTHSGDTYHAAGPEGVRNIHDESLARLNRLKNEHSSSFPGLIISVGDTPSCSIVEDLGDADEIRPGNFVYYDLMQYRLGACELNDIAVSVACPVAGIYPLRDELVVYGGAVHLSKEYLDGEEKHFGLVVRYTDGGWSDPLPNTRLLSLSQEHGIIRTDSDTLSSIHTGDILGILPVHSCLTANLLGKDTLMI